MTTTQPVERPTPSPPATSAWLGRAWAAVALIPVFFFVSLAMGYLLSDLLGYKPENNDAPIVVDLGVTVVVVAVSLAPCAGALIYGRRAQHAGDRRGRIPMGVGALVGLGLVVLTVVTTVGDALA